MDFKFKNKKNYFAVSLVLSMATARCQSNRHYNQYTNSDTQKIPDSIATANNKFGWSLYEKTMQTQANNNILISPISAYIALAMAQSGSTKKTLQEFQSTLHNEDIQDFESKISDFIKKLSTEQSNKTNESNSKNTEEQLHIANALWGNSSKIKFTSDYKKLIQQSYTGKVDEAPFTSQTVDQINAWVSDNTNKMIPTIVNQLAPEDVIVIVNAVFFQGGWRWPFYKVTSQTTFKNEESMLAQDKQGNPLQIQMMEEDDVKVPYLDAPTYQMISLPFITPNTDISKYSLDILLPKLGKSKLQDLTQAAIQDSYSALIKDAKQRKVDIKIPKFKFNTIGSIKQSLKAIGLNNPFTANSAVSFEKMIHPKDSSIIPYISDVVQATAVEMDENGFKAAAATAVMMALSSIDSMSDEANPKFVADHPFIFVLRHIPTGTALFIGSVTRPEW